QPCMSRKSCWVCFGSELDDANAVWIRPCRCRGTTKWVHHNCLMRWVDEKQKGHSYTKVHCPQCNTEYVITIPVGLVLGKLIQWDEYLLRFWRRHAHKLGLLNYLFPIRANLRPTHPHEAPAKEIKFTRVFCGAMLFPTIATIVGKFVFRKVDGNLQRSFLGGIAFVAIKGILKIYLKQQIYSRLGQRRITNY
uniref:E3 ubiquitin-protein ligase MARCHF5 n=1 Tax=Ciona savignyi TaxID=51511 RepID=H2YLS4_CIOSA